MYDMEQEIVANWTLKTLNAQQQRLELNAWPFVGGSPLRPLPMLHPDRDLNPKTCEEYRQKYTR